MVSDSHSHRMWKQFGVVIGLVCIAVVVRGSTNDFYKDVPSAYYMDCLVEINKYRVDHGSLPLRWAVDLQYHAQSWADHLARDNTVENDIESIDVLGQGQTVSYSSPAKQPCRSYPPTGYCYACQTTIAKWYNESKHYDYKTGYSVDGTKQVLDFTQLVWRDTIKVGIATAMSRQYGVITVARFYPRGNIGYVDDYVRNVAPLGSPVQEDSEFSGNSEAHGPSCETRKRKRTRGYRPRIPSPQCRNEYEDLQCEYYKDNFPGYCLYHRIYMAKHCAKTCNYCEDRFPAPPIQETKEEKKHNLRWNISKWKKCHGDLQWREVRCIHKYNSLNYEVNVRFCARHVSDKPSQYKDCS